MFLLATEENDGGATSPWETRVTQTVRWAKNKKQQHILSVVYSPTENAKLVSETQTCYEKIRWLWLVKGASRIPGSSEYCMCCGTNLWENTMIMRAILRLSFEVPNVRETYDLHLYTLQHQPVNKKKQVYHSSSQF